MEIIFYIMNFLTLLMPGLAFAVALTAIALALLALKNKKYKATVNETIAAALLLGGTGLFMYKWITAYGYDNLAPLVVARIIFYAVFITWAIRFYNHVKTTK